MSPLGKRVIVLSMFWVFLVMIFIQVYDNVTGKGMPRSEPAIAQPTSGPDPAVSRLADLQACVAADPRNLQCILELGDTYYVNNQWPQAQVSYERALELDPHNTGTMVKLAGTLIYQDMFDRAIPVLDQASQLQPASPEIQLLLGLALSRSEPPRPEEAVAAWQKVIQLAPDSPFAEQAAQFIAEAAP